MFTDIAVMQLVERGEIDIDAPIQDHVPDFTPTNDTETPITLRQLMSHRAGVIREPPRGTTSTTRARTWRPRSAAWTGRRRSTPDVAHEVLERGDRRRGVRAQITPAASVNTV
jgi:CubicO group peptidase (beta-lactamase class C family)